MEFVDHPKAFTKSFISCVTKTVGGWSGLSEHQTEVHCQKRHQERLIHVVVTAHFNSWGQGADFKVLFVGHSIMALGTLLGGNNQQLETFKHCGHEIS